ncbi:peptidase inhibitor family I36 protein [Longispora sp. K20-0274]|uniref:peptidase inhibitor family I36 protein n=1 Tax=Longispora sp. K20-0274 TaxID=3088255 RepID=UPI00399B359A
MRTKKTIRGVLAATLLTATAVLGATAPASAAPGYDGSFCIYNPGGHNLCMNSGAYDLSGVAGGIFNDNVSWATNDTGDNWCLYSDAGYNGDIQVIPTGYSGDLNGFGWRLSSLRSRPWYGC